MPLIQRCTVALIPLPLATLLTGCDVAIDCPDRDGPRFDTRTIPAAVLNQVYTTTITVNVEDEPYDDRFDYTFRLNGDLPDGVQTSVLGRQFFIDGTPIESGQFDFELQVAVDDGLTAFESGLCYRTRRRDFRLDVSVM